MHCYEVSCKCIGACHLWNSRIHGADLNKCFNGAMELVKRFTRISLSIFPHAIVSRFKSGKGPSKLIHETTLELLQFVSVALIESFHTMNGTLVTNINVSCIVKNAIKNLAGVETYSKFLERHLLLFFIIMV
jgi:hypothetical protein